MESKIRPDNKPIHCNYITCFFGMGQAGRGVCPGTWWKEDCAEYRNEEEALKDWKEENETHI